MTTPALFPTCPLPGCTNLTDDPRRPCPQCLAAFGDWLRPAATPVSEDDFAAAVAERDAAVRAVLAERWARATHTTTGLGHAQDERPARTGRRRPHRMEAQPNLLVLRTAPHLPHRPGQPERVDLQEVPGDHMNRQPPAGQLLPGAAVLTDPAAQQEPERSFHMDTHGHEKPADIFEAEPEPEFAHYSTGRLTPPHAEVVDRWRARLLDDRPLPGQRPVGELLRLAGIDDRPRDWSWLATPRPGGWPLRVASRAHRCASRCRSNCPKTWPGPRRSYGRKLSAS